MVLTLESYLVLYALFDWRGHVKNYQSSKLKNDPLKLDTSKSEKVRKTLPFTDDVTLVALIYPIWRKAHP